MEKKQEICYVDTGGTFTDAFIMDNQGSFVIAKASTTSDDVSQGFYQALERGAQELGLSLSDLLGQIDTLGFGSTVVVNTLLTRTGRKSGMIITKGFEDLLEMQRGLGTWIHLDALGRIHPQAHEYGEPLIERALIRGVTERIDNLGQVLIPAYEDEARQAAKELMDEGVGAIVIISLWGFLNNTNEKRMAEIAREVVGDKIEIIEATEISPTAGEFARACTASIEAYTAPKLRNSLRAVYRELKKKGFGKDLLIMQSMGGVSTAEWVLAVNTIQSGPVGGLIGSKYIGDLYGYDNIVTCDVGGTSFDVGLIVDGKFRVIEEPSAQQMLVSHPIAEIVSIGAGGGTIAGVDPISNSFFVGPQSAGSSPGPACYDSGGENPTVSDADVVLGYIDPDYFLGGKLRLNKQKATDAIKKHVADPLGLDVVEAAAGIKAMIDTQMRLSIRKNVIAKGYDAREFVVMAFGGAGPSHVAGFTEGIPFKEILVFPYSGAFSAFGAACADIAFTHIRSVSVMIPPNLDDEGKMAVSETINEGWEFLEKPAYKILEKQGVPRSEISIVRTAAMKYGKQLHAISIVSPVDRIRSPQDLDKLIADFERDYEKMYTYAARYPGAGIEVYSVGVTTSVSNIKPKLARYELGSKTPSKAALKGKREAYFGKRMTPVNVYEMGELTAGNVITGPAIIEAPTFTTVIPENAKAEVDEYRTLRLKRED